MRKHSRNVGLLITGIVIGVAISHVLAAGSQEAAAPRPSGEEVAGMAAMMNAMSPMWAGMIEGMMEAQLSVLAKPDTADRLATFTKNYYDALVAKQFTSEEVIRIVTSTGIPALANMR